MPSPSQDLIDPSDIRARIRDIGRMLGGPVSLDVALGNAEDALAAAAVVGDQALVLDALELRVQVLTGMGQATADDWHAVESAARGCGEWQRAASALRMQAMRLLDDRADEAERPAARLVALATSHGMPADLAWAESIRAEIAFLTGEWDDATTIAIRAVAAAGRAGDATSSLRGWHIVIPIAAARRDETRLGLSYYPYTLRRQVAADTPYRRMLDVAAFLRFADAGLAEPLRADPASLLPAIAGSAVMPHWLAAVEIVVADWIGAGEFAAAEHALEAMSASRVSGNSSSLGAGVEALLRARLTAAEGGMASGVAAHAWHALEMFTIAKAPWWIAKAVRVLTRAKEATPALRRQAELIDAALGIQA